VTALRKKAIPKHRLVVTLRTEEGDTRTSLTVIDRNYESGPSIDLLTERVSMSTASSEIFKIKDVESLDSLIEALMGLRETYE